MKILVTGGLGFVGHGLCKALLDAGHEVHALGRTIKPNPAKLLAGLVYHSHDLAKDAPPNGCLDGTDAVFHAAAKAGVGGTYEQYRLANLVATEQLLSASKYHGVPRFIYTSTPSVVFSTKPIREGDESLTYSTESFSDYASSKAQAERMVLSANDPSRIQTLALRPHLVWGAGDPHLMPRVIQRHRSGKLRIVGDGTNRVDLTHVENVVHAHLCALRSLIANPSLGGNPYFIGQDEPVILWEWINHVFAQIGLPPLEKSISYRTARTVGWVMEQAWKFLPMQGEPPMTRFVACQLANDHWFSCRAAEKDLGYKPVLSMKQALEKTLPWLRAL